MNNLISFFLPVFLSCFIEYYASSQTLTYTYDAAGNRTGRSISVKNSDVTSPSILNPESDELTTEYQSLLQNAVLEGAEVTPGVSTTLRPGSVSGSTSGLGALVSSTNLNGHAITIYPNPTRGELVVKVENPEKTGTGSLSVSNANGNELLRQNGLNLFNPVDLTNYPVGVYLLTISVDGKSTIWKVVRE